MEEKPEAKQNLKRAAYFNIFSHIDFIKVRFCGWRSNPFCLCVYETVFGCSPVGAWECPTTELLPVESLVWQLLSNDFSLKLRFTIFPVGYTFDCNWTPRPQPAVILQCFLEEAVIIYGMSGYLSSKTLKQHKPVISARATFECHIFSCCHH